MPARRRRRPRSGRGPGRLRGGPGDDARGDHARSRRVRRGGHRRGAHRPRRQPDPGRGGGALVPRVYLPPGDPRGGRLAGRLALPAPSYPAPHTRGSLMRIVHVTDLFRPGFGGIELFVEDLALRQARAGHDVCVLTATAPRGEQDAGPVRVFRTPPSVLHPLAPRPARMFALGGDFDVVHAHLSVLSLFATTVARWTDEAGIPTVNTVHSMWGGRRAVVRSVRSLADWDRATVGWTAVSHAAAAEMRDVLHPTAEVQVVPNAVDVDWWRDGPPRRTSERPVTFVTVMRLAGRKRPFALLAMLEQLRATVPATVPLRMLVIGDGPLDARLRADLGARRLDRWVQLLGRRTREEIRALYAAADVYVSPAHQESFGLAALEARAAGLPVVAMRTGGVGEFVEPGLEGLLCHDDADMTSAMAALAIDDALRSRIAGHNAVHRPMHDWPTVLAGFEDVYRSVGGRVAGRRRIASADPRA